MDKIINWYNAEIGMEGTLVIMFVVAVLFILWFIALILRAKDKSKDKNTNRWIKKKREIQVIKGVAERQRVDDGSNQELKPVFINTEGEPTVINGYYQKSNTAPIRPVYSNTHTARRVQMEELESERIGAEAYTSALVMNSSAPSAVLETGSVPQKVKPTKLKRPTAAKTSASDVQPAEAVNPDDGEDSASASMYQGGIRPTVGSEVANAVTERPAEVQEEKPDILKYGEEAIIPAATAPAPGFASAKKGPIKRPKSASITKNIKEDEPSGTED